VAHGLLHVHGVRTPLPRVLVVAIFLALAVDTAAVGAAQAGRPDLDPHVHGSAAVRPVRLVSMAQKSGDLRAGLNALGLGHLPTPKAVKHALKLMDLHRTDHGAAYDAISDFRRAAFQTRGYSVWVREVVRNVRANAKHTYMQLSPREMDNFLATARAEAIDLDGIELLASMPRRNPNTKALADIFVRHPEAAGLDILGAEKDELDPKAIDQALDVLLGSGRPSPVFRIHAGEGYLGEHGARNVNTALRALVDRSAKSDLRKVRFVLAHVARVNDVGAAKRDLAILRARGLDIQVNVNPLSNLVYKAVPHVADIDALQLGVELVPGSDNVGSLESNARIVELLAAGKHDQAARLAQRIRNIQSGLYQRSIQSLPP
jgi:hypothetical protein